MDASLGRNGYFNRSEYKPRSTLPIINTSKSHVRDLTMCVSSDLPRITDMISNIVETNKNTNPHAVFAMEVNTQQHGRVKWKNKAGESFGFPVQITSANRLLIESTIGTVDEPVLFPAGYNMLYIIEGSGVNVPVSRKPPASTSRFTMYIAAGEENLMKELKLIFEKLYPGKSDDVVKMCGLHCGGDVNWTFTETGEQVGPIIERKKSDDFVASKMDERQLQLPVMLANAPNPSFVWYVVEGNILTTKSAMDEKAKMGSLVYPLLRDGISTACVADTASTAALLANIHLQMEWCEESKLRKSQAFHGKALNSGETKASLIANGGRYELNATLTNIPGISDSIAAEISNVYPTFGDLMLALIDAFDPVLMLSELNIPRASGTNKRLGKAAATAIVDRFKVGIIKAGISRGVGVTSSFHYPPPPDAQNNNNNNNKTEVSPAPQPPPLVKQKVPGPVFKAAVEVFQANQRKKNDPPPLKKEPTLKWKPVVPKKPAPVFQKALEASRKRKAQEIDDDDITDESEIYESEDDDFNEDDSSSDEEAAPGRQIEEYDDGFNTVIDYQKLKSAPSVLLPYPSYKLPREGRLTYAEFSARVKNDCDSGRLGKEFARPMHMKAYYNETYKK